MVFVFKKLTKCYNEVKMVSIAWRNLFKDKIRFLISIGGVAFSVFLILILLGLYSGWTEKIVRYIDSVPADLWIVQKGGDDFYNSVSFLSPTIKERIEKIDNVKEVYPLIGRPTSLEIEGKVVRMYIIAFDTEVKIGGPMKIIKGKKAPGENEIIIDKIFSRTKKVNIGDDLEILNSKFKVAGISEGGDLIFTQFAFIRQEDVGKLHQNSNNLPPGLDTSNSVSFYLVGLEDLSKTEATIENIESKIDGVSAIAKEEFKENNRREIKDIFIPILTVLVIIGFLVGLTVVGLMTYTSTVEKSKEYGILKAIGASNSYLYRIVFQQSLVTGVVGFLIGGVITFGATAFLEDPVPQFATRLELSDIFITLVLMLFMIVLSAYVPMRRIAHIEPATVFK